MRQIKALKGMLNGGTWLAPGDVAEVDDFRATQLVELGHAVSVAEISIDLTDVVAAEEDPVSTDDVEPAQAVPAQVVEQAAVKLDPPQPRQPRRK